MISALLLRSSDAPDSTDSDSMTFVRDGWLEAGPDVNLAWSSTDDPPAPVIAPLNVTEPAVSIWPVGLLPMSPLMVESIRLIRPWLVSLSAPVPRVMTEPMRLRVAPAALLLAAGNERLASIDEILPELVNDPPEMVALDASIFAPASTVVFMGTISVLEMRLKVVPNGPV